MKAKLRIERDNIIKPNDNHFKELYLIYLFVQGIMKNPRTTNIYRKGYINEKGDILRMPETQKEWDNFSLLEAFFIKIRYLLSPRLSEFTKFNKLGIDNYMSMDKVKLFGVSNDYKMKLMNELFNDFLNINKDDKTKL